MNSSCEPSRNEGIRKYIELADKFLAERKRNFERGSELLKTDFICYY